MSFLEWPERGLPQTALRRVNMDPAQPNDQQDMGQLMGGVPQDAFQQHATNALSQVDPQEYQNPHHARRRRHQPARRAGQGDARLARGQPPRQHGRRADGRGHGQPRRLAGGQRDGRAGGAGGHRRAWRICSASTTATRSRWTRTTWRRSLRTPSRPTPARWRRRRRSTRTSRTCCRACWGTRRCCSPGAGLAAGVMSGQLQPKF